MTSPTWYWLAGKATSALTPTDFSAALMMPLLVLLAALLMLTAGETRVAAL